MSSKRKGSNRTVKAWQDDDELSTPVDDDDEQWISDMVTYMKSCSASLRDIRDLLKDLGSILHERPTPAKKPKTEPKEEPKEL